MNDRTEHFGDIAYFCQKHCRKFFYRSEVAAHIFLHSRDLEGEVGDDKGGCNVNE